MNIIGPERIIFTRHPQCLHNVAHQKALEQKIPHKESPLTEIGEAQRDITAGYLKDNFPDIESVFCSTFLRTTKIPEAMGMDYVANKGLDERNLGIWYDNSTSAVIKKYPDEIQRQKDAGYYHYEPTQGESCIAVDLRVINFVLDILFKCRGVVYVSGHGVSGLCLRRRLTDSSVTDWYKWYNDRNQRFKNASVTVYDRSRDGYKISLLNYIPWEGEIDPALLN